MKLIFFFQNRTHFQNVAFYTMQLVAIPAKFPIFDLVGIMWGQRLANISSTVGPDNILLH